MQTGAQVILDRIEVPVELCDCLRLLTREERPDERVVLAQDSSAECSTIPRRFWIRISCRELIRCASIRAELPLAQTSPDGPRCYSG